MRRSAGAAGVVKRPREDSEEELNDARMCRDARRSTQNAFRCALGDRAFDTAISEAQHWASLSGGGAAVLASAFQAGAPLKTLQAMQRYASPDDRRELFELALAESAGPRAGRRAMSGDTVRSDAALDTLCAGQVDAVLADTDEHTRLRLIDTAAARLPKTCAALRASISRHVRFAVADARSAVVAGHDGGAAGGAGGALADVLAKKANVEWRDATALLNFDGAVETVFQRKDVKDRSGAALVTDCEDWASSADAVADAIARCLEAIDRTAPGTADRSKVCYDRIRVEGVGWVRGIRDTTAHTLGSMDADDPELRAAQPCASEHCKAWTAARGSELALRAADGSKHIRNVLYRVCSSIDRRYCIDCRPEE